MKHIDLPPYAPILMESTRAIGYSLEAAIADVIDNSIAAMASEVKLCFFPVDSEYVAILDNGSGMNSEEINVAMQYGSKNPTETRESSDLGRFGLGLKTASLSQCRTLTVVSKQGKQIECRQWDLDYIAQTGLWSLNIFEKEEVVLLPEVDNLNKYESGTLVIWQNLDRMKVGEDNFEQAMGRKMDDVRKHLALVYHRYLSGETGLKKLCIYFNEDKIKQVDPFLENKSVQAMDDETLTIHGNKVIVRPYILPHISKLTLDEVEMLGGKDGIRKQQGYYVYRNKRLLVWGTWFRMMRQGELSKLVRIRVDIPNALDDLWTLDIKKSSAVPPTEVRKNLSAVVEKMAERSKRTWTCRGKKEVDDSISHVWNRLKTGNGGYIYEINQDYTLISEMIVNYPTIRKDLLLLLRQIETGLPLNSLYVDLVNDVILHNDSPVEEKVVLQMVKGILENLDQSGYAEMIERLKLSEPFCYYIESIDRAWERGEFI